MRVFKLMGEMLAELKDGHVNLTLLMILHVIGSGEENYPSNFDSEVQQNYLQKIMVLRLV